MEKKKRSKLYLAIALLFIVLACIAFWAIMAPQNIIKNVNDVDMIVFSYAHEYDTGHTTVGMIVQSDNIKAFSQSSDQYKYVSGKPLIKGKAVNPDGEPIWIAVQYNEGTVDRFIVFPNGSFVIIKNSDTRPRVGRIGLFSSQKGVDFYEGLVDRYPTMSDVENGDAQVKID